MKKLYLVPLIFLLFLCSLDTVRANRINIVSGQLFVGGTSFGTNDYQTYLAFNLSGLMRMPQKEYIFYGEQFLSVYQDHPIHPVGDYEFSVKMPYSPDGISINGQIHQPVWYSDSRWTIWSSVVTPTATETSPRFVNVQAPFRLNGFFAVYGARKVHAKCSGRGEADLKFEKIGGRYFFLEGRYDFHDSAVKNRDAEVKTQNLPS